MSEPLTNASAFLRNHRLASLSTIDSVTASPDGAFVYYMVDDSHTIYFSTAKDSRKLKNITTNNNISLVIGQEVPPIELQIKGTAYLVEDLALKAELVKKYSRVSNENRNSQSWPPLIPLTAKTSIEFLKVTVSWVKYSDFTSYPPVIIEGTAEQL